MELGDTGGVGGVEVGSGYNVTVVHIREILKKCRKRLRKTCDINLWHLNTHVHVHGDIKHTYTYTKTNYSNCFVQKKCHWNYKCSIIYINL